MSRDEEFKVVFSDGSKEITADVRNSSFVFESNNSDVRIKCGHKVVQIPKTWDVSCPECTVLRVEKDGFEHLSFREKKNVQSVAIPFMIKRFPKCYKVKGPVTGGEIVSGDVKVDFWCATRIDEPARMMSCALHTPREPKSIERVYSKFEADLENGPKFNPNYNKFLARNFRFLLWGGLGHKAYIPFLQKRIAESDALADLWLDANCYSIAMKACDDNVQAKARINAWGIRHYDDIQEHEMKKMDVDLSEWGEVTKMWYVFINDEGANLTLKEKADTVTIPPAVGNTKIAEVNLREGCNRVLIGGYIGNLDLNRWASAGVTEVVLGEGADFGTVIKDRRIKVTGSDDKVRRFELF